MEPSEMRAGLQGSKAPAPLLRPDLCPENLVPEDSPRTFPRWSGLASVVLRLWSCRSRSSLSGVELVETAEQHRGRACRNVEARREKGLECVTESLGTQ